MKRHVAPVKTQQVCVRLTPDEHQELAEFAAVHHMTLPELLRSSAQLVRFTTYAHEGTR